MFPACVWSPDALVPAPEYRRRVEARQNALESAGARIRRLQQSLSELHEESAEAVRRGWDVRPQLDPREPATVGNRIQGTEEELVRARRDYEQARAELVELTGVDPGGVDEHDDLDEDDEEPAQATA